MSLKLKSGISVMKEPNKWSNHIWMVTIMESVPMLSMLIFASRNVPESIYKNFPLTKSVIYNEKFYGWEVPRSYGVMAITLDFESNNPSSNLGRTLHFCRFEETIFGLSSLRLVKHVSCPYQGLSGQAHMAIFDFSVTISKPSTSNIITFCVQFWLKMSLIWQFVSK